jgi:hypothetical protein
MLLGFGKFKAIMVSFFCPFPLSNLISEINYIHVELLYIVLQVTKSLYYFSRLCSPCDSVWQVPVVLPFSSLMVNSIIW